ncbi:MAG: murein biosynthesis integral membrane protein MurJ [Peptococcaceae bacterium]|jgi:putative peptidoglycan lipid II flippase|nr:murein biosynthesis integral membrane protein MurJ [Peptococcaceae bacterium]MDH7524535.1 murein biosynthesis integral membrane protein MurJ [Peptococcaceae bacterium]
MNYERAGNVGKAAFMIAAVTVISKILGFVREVVIAQKFGATGVTDAFLVVFNIPYLLYGVFNTALVVVVVPIYLEYLFTGRKREATRLLSAVLLIATTGLVILVYFALLYADIIIGVFAPGFNQETARLASNLTLIIFPSIIFFALSSFFMGILNSHNVFGPPSLVPVVLNVFIIVSAYTIALDYGIYGLALGVLLGASAAALMLLLSLKKAKFKFSLPGFSDPSLWKVFGLMLPVFFSGGAAQLNTLIIFFFGSILPEGSISAINYAKKLTLLPEGIFVMAIGTALFPSLSRAAVVKQLRRFAEKLNKGIKTVIFITAPAAVGLMVLRYPIVELLYKRGAFGDKAVEMTSGALLFLSLGLVGQCLVPVLSRGYYALQDTMTPVKVTVLAVGVNIALSAIFVGMGKHLGLALANAAACIVNALFLGIFLTRRVKGLNRGLTGLIIKVIFASMAMGLCVKRLDSALYLYDVNKFILAIRLGIDVLAGITVYFIAGFLLKIDVLYYLLGYVQELFKKKAASNLT